MNFLKENLATKLMKNEIDIKKLSIFKIILAIGLIYVLQFIVLAPLYLIFELSDFTLSFASESLLLSLSFLIALLLTIKIFSNKTKDSNELKFKYKKPMTLTKKGVLYCILLAIGYLLINVGTLGHLLDAIPIPETIQVAFSQILEQNFLFIIFSLVVEAAIIEEVLLRGFILRGLLNKYSPKVAIIISALLFGAIHMNVPQFINATIIGLIIGILYYKTNSLAYCMIFHATNNLFALFILTPSAIVPKILISIVYVGLGGLAFVYAFKKLELNLTIKKLFKKGKKVIFINKISA